MSKKEKIIIISLCTSFVILLILFLIPFKDNLASKKIYKNKYSNSNVVVTENYDYIVNKTNYGKELEIINYHRNPESYLVIPSYIDGMKVTKINLKNFDSYDYKVYIPKGVQLTNNGYQKYVVLQEPYAFERSNSRRRNIYSFPNHFDVENIDKLATPNALFYYCNLIYLTNVDNEVYFKDVYKDQLIDYIPNDPVRKGYVFKGWYKEKECINKWDFENDICAASEFNFLFAKWEVE